MASVLAGNWSAEHTRLSGAERVAALLLSIDPARAARLLHKLDQSELRQTTKALAQLGDIDNSALEALYDEFFASFGVGPGLNGGAEKAESLLSEAFPAAQVTELLSNVFGRQESNVWATIPEFSESAVAQYLSEEHPRVVTYVLSRLEPAFVAKIIPHLPSELRNLALCRMISSMDISQAAARVIETSLREDLLGATARSAPGTECEKVANIINSLDSADFESVVHEIGRDYPIEARLIRKMLFSFEDIPRLSRRALSIVFDRVSTELLVLALRGTDADFRNVVLSTLASRSRRLVESELTSPTTPPAKDIAKARKDITALVLSLAQRNEIELSSADEPGPSDSGRGPQ